MTPYTLAENGYIEDLILPDETRQTIINSLKILENKREIMNYEKIKNEIKEFVEERDWEQFHTPKNLSMALSVEASELLEIFQWQKEEEYKNATEKEKEMIKDEIADILYYLVRISEKLNINIEEAFFNKMKKNREKYRKIEKSLSPSLSPPLYRVIIGCFPFFAQNVIICSETARNGPISHLFPPYSWGSIAIPANGDLLLGVI